MDLACNGLVMGREERLLLNNEECAVSEAES